MCYSYHAYNISTTTIYGVLHEHQPVILSLNSNGVMLVLHLCLSQSSEMVLLLEELVDVPYSSTVIPTIDMPVQRSSVLITERDLRYIVSAKSGAGWDMEW